MKVNRERFECWLFNQPDDREYNYSDTDDCLICKFFKDTTQSAPSVGGDYYRFGNEVIQFEGWLFDLMVKGSIINGGFESVAISRTFKQVKALWISKFGNPLAIDEAPLPTNQMATKSLSEMQPEPVK